MRILVSLHPCQHLLLLLPFEYGHFNWGKMKSQCFDLHLFCNQESWTLLHVFTGHLYFFLWEFPVLFMCPFFHWNVVFGGWVFWIPCRFWILDPYWMSSWQRFFSHSLGCLLSLVTVSFGSTGFELRTWCLLGRHSNTRASLPLLSFPLFLPLSLSSSPLPPTPFSFPLRQSLAI
jgi:hypothetical protein